MADFDFKEWADLYQVDPDAFNARKEAVLARFVEQAPEDNRPALEQTLFRIRMSALRAKSPLQSALEANKLMWESFGKLREKLEEFEQLSAATEFDNSARPNSLRLVGVDNPTHSRPASPRMSADQAALQQPPAARIIPFKASGKPAH
ncbi:DUF3135 domain-containing protein [Limnobacter humi]|uniref:DUF3135 domain-containing protein n=1 Tax=Limnobacter humi TaxID=1778671 RepID=A0ABT1WEL2_9BURK|nr:DUF3135 domain-containing protein [Limnobacter humi]MCQ8895963.1 DUF3135 domain-containing protein [Limnobacter humi]